MVFRLLDVDRIGAATYEHGDDASEIHARKVSGMRLYGFTCTAPVRYVLRSTFRYYSISVWADSRPLSPEMNQGGA